MSIPVTRKKHTTKQNISLLRQEDIKMLDYKVQLTLWRPAAFEDIRKKTPKRTWLCAEKSFLLYGLRTWSKRQKMQQVF